MSDSESVDILSSTPQVQFKAATAADTTSKAAKPAKKRRAQQAELSTASASENETRDFTKFSDYYLQLAVDNLKMVLDKEFDYSKQLKIKALINKTQ